MNRTEASFVVNSYDILERAIHKARLWAERKHSFEKSKMSVNVPNVSLTAGGLLTAAVNTDDITESVKVKTVLRAFLTFSDNSGQFPISVISREAHMERLKRRYANATTISNAELTSMPIVPADFAAVRMGDKIYVVPPNSASYNGSSTITLKLDVVRFQPDYHATDHPTDFFLEDCEDFMLLRSIVELNFFLKEDQRVPISAAALKDSWESVLAWDASLVKTTSDDANLD